MLPACTTMGGMCLAPGDVCKTPTPAGPVPVPYVNTSQMMLAVGTSTKVFVLGAPAVTLASQIPISSGDEPGTAGGVVSGVFMGPTRFLQGSSTVLVEGLPWVYLGATTGQNGLPPNAPGNVISPSQNAVLVSP